MKKTNKEMFTEIKTVIENSANLNDYEKNEIIEFINSRIELIDKKAKTLSKADIEKINENEKIKTEIINALTEIGKPIKISEMIKMYKPLNNYTTQKITPIISKLIVENKVDKMICKRETLYFIKENN